ncbi:sensor histidine kinase [Paenibacillus profundus]|uniref:Sensor histidine kinase n=1 Tax=Paenibacillus profundus TaxID=1173085 RepID=A0ABS8YEN8_9BACL|nr:sensor histidine kinase [Paenibacillus profundus]MCE5169527.1 sensor histidine kinase [Paenibacillus profundus]
MTLQKLHSLRSKLLVLYFIVLMIPMIVIVYVMPSYFYNVITDKTSMQTETILESLSKNMETYLDDLVRLTITPYLSDEVMTALKLKASSRYSEVDDYTKLLSERALRNSLPNLMRNLRSDILGIVLLPLDGSTYMIPSSQGGQITENYPFRDQAWYKKAYDADGKTVFISPHPRDYVTNPAVSHAFSVARLIQDPDSRQPLAVLMADADLSIINHLVKDIEFDVSSVVSIYDQDDKLIFSNHDLSEEMQLQVVQAGEVVKGEHDSYVKIAKKMSSSGWSIVVLLSETELMNNIRWFYIVGALFAIAGVVATFLLFNLLSRWIINPYNKLLAAMNRFRRGDWQSRIEVKSGSGEIHELSLAYNMMADQISDMVIREYIGKLQLKEAEYRALQSQIQPHFLYNTLNGFIGLNRMNKRDVLEEAIVSLSRMLRYTLEDRTKSTVREEFDFLQRYCELQQMRFGDKFTFRIAHEEEVGEYTIPKLLLQPLVENAIIHGIEPLRRPAALQVNAAMELVDGEQWLSIVIEDTGKGFDAAAVRPNAVGLVNTKERLNLLYQSPVFAVQSAVHEGTKITIQIRKEEVSA